MDEEVRKREREREKKKKKRERERETKTRNGREVEKRESNKSVTKRCKNVKYM